MFKVIRGNPTPEELAAALAVVRVRAAGTATDGGDSYATFWADHALALRRIPHPGPTTWRTSAWTR